MLYERLGDLALAEIMTDAIGVSHYQSERNTHLAHNYICEQDGRDGESDSSDTVSLVPDSMYPLPIGITFCHASIQRNQEKDRSDRSKEPDRCSCKENAAPRRVPR
jgi:hypothetical protein